MICLDQICYKEVDRDVLEVVFCRVAEALCEDTIRNMSDEQFACWLGSYSPGKTLQLSVSLLHTFKDLAIPTNELVVAHWLIAHCPLPKMCLKRRGSRRGRTAAITLWLRSIVIWLNG